MSINSALKQYSTADNLNARIRLHEKYSTNKEGFHEWVFKQMNLKEGMKILECGTGPGALWYKNRENIPVGCEITVVDLSEGMLEAAQKNIGDVKGVKFNYMIQDIQSMEFADDSFDIVIANHMLYHVANIDQALLETRRVLKKDGFFYSSTFGKNHLKEIDEITRKFVEMPANRTSDRFCLENGAYMILSAYGKTELRKQPDSLVVTDPQDLIDYILSGSNAAKQLVDKKKEEFEKYVKQLFEENNQLCIQKDTGVFICKK